MKEQFNPMEIGYSTKMILNDECENVMLSEELFDKYKLVIDESKIEQIIAKLPEEQRYSLTLEEKMEYVKKILDYDVSTPIKNLFDDVICFVSKL